MHWLIKCRSKPGTDAVRTATIDAHRDFLDGYPEVTWYSGPLFTDDNKNAIGSLRLIEFPDRAAAEQHVADEPYVTGGVQKRWLINRWRPSVPHTWRDCPRTEGNIQALFHGIDGPDGREIRAANKDAHEAYLNEHGTAIMCRGPILADDGASPIGSVILMDIPDLAVGRALLENEPFFKAGCYQDITFHRWRFGRVFDRYKL